MRIAIERRNLARLGVWAVCTALLVGGQFVVFHALVSTGATSGRGPRSREATSIFLLSERAVAQNETALSTATDLQSTEPKQTIAPAVEAHPSQPESAHRSHRPQRSTRPRVSTLGEGHIQPNPNAIGSANTAPKNADPPREHDGMKLQSGDQGPSATTTALLSMREPPDRTPNKGPPRPQLDRALASESLVLNDRAGPPLPPVPSTASKLPAQLHDALVAAGFKPRKTGGYRRIERGPGKLDLKFATIIERSGGIRFVPLPRVATLLGLRSERNAATIRASTVMADAGGPARPSASTATLPVSFMPAVLAADIPEEWIANDREQGPGSRGGEASPDRGRPGPHFAVAGRFAFGALRHKAHGYRQRQIYAETRTLRDAIVLALEVRRLEASFLDLASHLAEGVRQRRGDPQRARRWLRLQASECRRDGKVSKRDLPAEQTRLRTWWEATVQHRQALLARCLSLVQAFEAGLANHPP